jgi:hypothetical protein
MQIFLFESNAVQFQARKREVRMVSDVPIMDSGAAGTVCPKEYAKDMAETVVTGNEKTYRTASGERDKASGHRFVEAVAETAQGHSAHVGVNYQVGPVTRPIVSTSQSTKQKKAVWFTEESSGVCPIENFHFKMTGDYIPLVEKNGVYEMHMKPIKAGESFEEPEMIAPVEEVSEEINEQAEHPKLTNKMLNNPVEPTAKEIQDHNVSHVVFRSWCQPCVSGKTKEDQHRRIKNLRSSVRLRHQWYSWTISS